MKKFTKQYYRVGVNHFQVWVKPNMFLEAKLHKDGTYDLLMTNPKFTKPVLGKKISISDVLKEKTKFKINHEYLHGFFIAIEEMAKSLTKKSIKK